MHEVTQLTDGQTREWSMVNFGHHAPCEGGRKTNRMNIGELPRVLFCSAGGLDGGRFIVGVGESGAAGGGARGKFGREGVGIVGLDRESCWRGPRGGGAPVKNEAAGLLSRRGPASGEAASLPNASE